MEDELLGIGRLASLSGLPVSALRFYDGAGVLQPARVDPASGYRFYERGQIISARLVAHLRRVGLPLSDIRTVLADPAQAPSVLAAHLRRLEAGLTDARREISIVHRLLDTKENAMTHCTLDAPDLVAALSRVRHAVSSDPELPSLNGIFLDSEPGRLRVVATDRFRLATSWVAMAEAADIHVLLPTEAVDELLAGDHQGRFELVLAVGVLSIAGENGTVRVPVPDVDFPPYRTLLESGRWQVPIDAAALRAELESGTPETRTRERDGVIYELSRLTVSASGVGVVASGDPGSLVVGVNRQFLLQALQDGDQLTLGLDDPLSPLAIRDRTREDTMSLLMPVRLDESA